MTKNLTTGGLIRERRIAQALSLGQLASRLGVPPASVRAWERGDEPLPEKLAPSVADALGLKAADLITTEPAPPAAKEKKPPKAEPAPTAAVVPAPEAPATAQPPATPKKATSPKTKADAAAKPAEAPQVDEVIDADAPTEPPVEPAIEAVVEPVAEAKPVEEVASAGDVDTKQPESAEPQPTASDDSVVDEQPLAAAVDAADDDTSQVSGTDEKSEASEAPAETPDTATPLTELPTEVVEAVPVAFTDEVTQAVPQVPSRPSVDDLASTAAVDALLSGTATSTSSTQVVGAPVTVVAEKLPYWKDPNQRWRYWARAIATVAIMGVFLVVLGWAFGELSDALGGFLDQFSDASDVDPLNRSTE
ncbi:MAG: helix-turn-helix domain-containing protein [Acidimicrobiia bacterium]|nr:helix-turn-helix domain-containing protein [Acidimicrobiia bacterium]